MVDGKKYYNSIPEVFEFRRRRSDRVQK